MTRLVLKNVVSSVCAGVIFTGISISAALAEAPAEAPLTPEEQAETDNRMKCKIRICNVLASKKAEDISCDTVKTVHKAKIEKKYLKGKMSWPFGKAQCRADVRLSGAMLVKGITTDGHKAALEKHNVSCSLFTTNGKDKHEISLSMTPSITWKGGKADSVVLNISDIKGTALAKSGIWTLAKANSYFGVLDGPFKDKFNDFLAKCPDLIKK